jgi:DNA (cytosine-5)-methyltransferase 1
MRRTGGNNEVCFEDLEKALAERPETYRHLDLIAFGFPCQDISIAGKGMGFAGEKSSLFFEAMRIVRLLLPKWVLIENVPGLLSVNKGRDFGAVLQLLAESGYGYCWNVLDSQYFGVAQRRKRLFIAGCLGNFCPAEILSEPASSGRNAKTSRKKEETVLCITTRTGERQDPTSETYIAERGRGGTKTNPNREGKTTGLAEGLDTARGIVIGNGITVPVMQWIGERIIKYATITYGNNSSDKSCGLHT